MSENTPQYGAMSPTPPAAAPLPPYSQNPYTQEPQGSGPEYYAPVPVTRKPTMGIAALILAALVFVVSLVWAIANGSVAATLPGADSATFEEAFAAGYESDPADGAAAAISIFGHVVLGTLAGVTALVLGIIATATKRGRAQGIVAIVIASIAPVISFLAYSVSTAASLG